MSGADPKRFLLVKGIAGLGNRLASLATAMVYARLSERTLVIDWSDPDYSPDGRNVFTEYFRTTGIPCQEQCPPAAQTEPAIWQGCTDLAAAAMVDRMVRDPRERGDRRIWRRLAADLGRLDHSAPVLVWWSYDSEFSLLRPALRALDTRHARLTDDQLLGEALRESLILNAPIHKRVETFRAEHFRGAMLGVHVRYTDKRSALGTIVRRVDRLLAGNPDLGLFLATDSREVARRFQARYPRVIGTDKWLPEDGKALHGRREEPGRHQHGADALVDLYLLAACDYLVADHRSAFARVAACLSAGSPAHSIDVSPARHLPRGLRRRLWVLGRVLRRIAPAGASA